MKAIRVFFLLALPLTAVAADLEFDAGEIPFSRFGSYLALSTRHDPQGALTIRDVSGTYPWNDNRVFRIDPLVKGEAMTGSIQAVPWMLQVNMPEGSIRICFEENDSLRITGRGADLRLTQLTRGENRLMPRKNGQYYVMSEGNSYVFTVLSGKLEIQGGNRIVSNEPAVLEVSAPEMQVWEIVLEKFRGIWKERAYIRSFEECVQEVKSDFHQFLGKVPDVPEEYRTARLLAAYITWSSVVRPAGFMTRRGMLMNKADMHHIWSWDNCFNALALAENNIVLAWEQLMILFDNQDEWGAMPDLLNDTFILRDYVKPPIHGWALRRMMDLGKVTPGMVREAYLPLVRWTGFWTHWRDDDGNGLPAYMHGYDSGWDNATVFDIGFPMEGPDLTAFLVLQMDTLADVALILDLQEDAASWKRRSDELLRKMIARFWNGERFLFKRAGEEEWQKQGDSLASYMPVVLGKKLPSEIREKLLNGLRNDFLTPFGLATENPKSPLYKPDGYWRGPIWAPTTLLLVDGIERCGDPELARTVVRRFCDMCGKNGFWENYDALTGMGLRDPSYTWTASVFLVLANQYLLGE